MQGNATATWPQIPPPLCATHHHTPNAAPQPIRQRLPGCRQDGSPGRQPRTATGQGAPLAQSWTVDRVTTARQPRKLATVTEAAAATARPGGRNVAAWRTRDAGESGLGALCQRGAVAWGGRRHGAVGSAIISQSRKDSFRN